MLRTQISLTQEERSVLDAESARTGRSISGLIRDAVDAAYGSKRSAQTDLEAMRRAFGSWQHHSEDGGAWVERVRTGERLRGVK
ncbi:MAG: ribbon-helix-helix protein, CopG family [Acidimicrobiales bacterium]